MIKWQYRKRGSRMTDKELSGLSKEDLVKLLLQADKSNSESSKRIAELSEERARLSEEKEVLSKEKERLSKENKELQDKVERLQKELELKKQLIKKFNIEKYVSKEDSVSTGKLFNASKAPGKVGTDKKEKPSQEAPKKERKKHNDLDKSLTEEELERLSKLNPTITNDDLSKYDPSKYRIVSLGERVSYVIMRIPAETRVYKVVTKTSKVTEIATGKETIVRPEPINISNSKYHSSVYSHIAFMKFFGGVPVFRYVRVESSQGIDIPLRTAYNLITGGSDMLSGLYEHMGTYIGDPRMPSVHIDESTIKAIDVKTKEDGTSRGTCYMLLTRGVIDKTHGFYYYQFAEDRKLDEIKDNLKNARDIVVHTDAYAAYRRILKDLEKNNVCHQTCVQHVIRYFLKVVDPGKKELDPSESVVAFVVQKLYRLYTLEAEFRDRGLSGDELTKARNAKGSSASVLKEVKDHLATVQTGNPLLKKAIGYFDNNYDTLVTFLKNPDATIHNNMAEEGFKILATDRNNFLFVRSRIGGKACAIHLTIQQTALSNGLDPCEYEEFLMETVRKRDFDNDYSKLLPWSDGIRERIDDYKRRKAALFSLSKGQVG